VNSLDVVVKENSGRIATLRETCQSTPIDAG
jgi:hypothetical protein